MDYIEIEVDGKILKMQKEVPVEETGIVERELEFDKTQELEVLSMEDINDKTITNIFGDNNE